jgi:hypothetical protein
MSFAALRSRIRRGLFKIDALGTIRMRRIKLAMASGCPYRPSSPQPTALRLDWMDMDDSGIGSHLTNEEKRAHLADLRRQHLIDQVCVQEILPPER